MPALMGSWYAADYWDGYFMTAEEDRQLKAVALLELSEARQRKNLVWEKASDLAKELETLSASLKTEPDNVASECYSGLETAIVELVADAKKALAGVRSAEDKARLRGCPTN